MSRTPLFPVVKNGKHGFIDKTGQIVIPPRFDDVGQFSEGLAPVRVAGKWGYVNESGEIVIAPQYDDFYGFSEGLSAVMTDPREKWFFNHFTFLMGKWGYIDRTGQMVIEPRFDFAYSFSEGLASVTIDEDFRPGPMEGYIDKTGKYIIEPQGYCLACSFSEGLGAISFLPEQAEIDGYDRSCVYVNKAGEVVLNPGFAFGLGFSEGLAMVEIRGWKEPGYGPAIFESKFGYIDISGRIAINPVFDAARSFSEGLAAVEVQGKWGFISKTGDVIIKPRYDEASDFSEGLAWVRTGRKVGFIGRTGTVVLEPRFHGAEGFHGGLARVSIGGPIYPVGVSHRPRVRIVIDRESDGESYPYEVSDWSKTGIGYVDTTGEYVWKPTS